MDFNSRRELIEALRDAKGKDDIIGEFSRDVWERYLHAEETNIFIFTIDHMRTCTANFPNDILQFIFMFRTFVQCMVCGELKLVVEIRMR